MHEMSLMAGVIDTVRDRARENNICRVKKVKLVIGRLSQALPDSLQFAFSVFAAEDIFQGAVLEIEERDIVCRCPNCSNEFGVEDGHSFICPNCQGRQVDIVAGRELYIDYFEGDVSSGEG